MASWNNKNAFANKQFQRDPTLADFVDLLKLTSGENYKFRFIGPVLEYRSHPVEIKLAVPSPKTGKITTGWSKMCLIQPGSKPGTVCPYCEAGMKLKTEFMQNVIDRSKQKNAPERKGKPNESETKLVSLWDGDQYASPPIKPTKGKIKDKKSDLWTPIVVLRCTSTLAEHVVNASEANQKTIKGKDMTFGAEHPRHGFDLLVKYNKDASTPGKMYSASKTVNTKLTDKELEYPLWNLAAAKPETVAVAQKEVERTKPKLFTKEKDGIYTPIFPEVADPKLFPDWFATQATASASKGKRKKDQQQDQQDQDDQEAVAVKPKKKKKKAQQDQDQEVAVKPKKKKTTLKDKKKAKKSKPVKSTKKKKKKKAA